MSEVELVKQLRSVANRGLGSVSVFSDEAADTITRLLKERDEARAEIERLEKAWRFMQEEKSKSNDEAKLWFDRYQELNELIVETQNRTVTAEAQVAALTKALERLGSNEAFYAARLLQHDDAELIMRIDFARKALVIEDKK